MSGCWEVGLLCLWVFGTAQHKTSHEPSSRTLAAKRLSVAAYFQMDSEKQKRIVSCSFVFVLLYFFCHCIDEPFIQLSPFLSDPLY